MISTDTLYDRISDIRDEKAKSVAESLVQGLSQHLAFVEKNRIGDRSSSLILGEIIEDIANQYLDLSEDIQRAAVD